MKTSLATDSAAYVAEWVARSVIGDFYRVTVVARFHNTSDVPVYLARCRPDSLTPFFGVVAADTTDRTDTGYVAGCAGVGHERQFEVPAGATRIDTVQLQWPGLVNGATNRPVGDVRGTFRLRYVVQACRGDGACEFAVAAGLSNAFTVRTAP